MTAAGEVAEDARKSFEDHVAERVLAELDAERANDTDNTKGYSQEHPGKG